MTTRRKADVKADAENNLSDLMTQHIAIVSKEFKSFVAPSRWSCFFKKLSYLVQGPFSKATKLCSASVVFANSSAGFC